ncbi:hypothetical protein T492DRAFT_892177, partial [Pavlovales sp. CCMP2436]
MDLQSKLAAKRKAASASAKAVAGRAAVAASAVGGRAQAAGESLRARIGRPLESPAREPLVGRLVSTESDGSSEGGLPQWAVEPQRPPSVESRTLRTGTVPVLVGLHADSPTTVQVRLQVHVAAASAAGAKKVARARARAAVGPPVMMALGAEAREACERLLSAAGQGDLDDEAKEMAAARLLASAGSLGRALRAPSAGDGPRAPMSSAEAAVVEGVLVRLDSVHGALGGCSVLLWLSDASGRHSTIRARWPARERAVWRSARRLLPHGLGLPPYFLQAEVEDASPSSRGGGELLGEARLSIGEAEALAMESEAADGSFAMCCADADDEEEVDPAEEGALVLRLALLPTAAHYKKRVFIIRHGESTWNQAQHRGNDHPLNVQGIGQARRLADALAAEQRLLRAQEAAAASATAGGEGEMEEAPVGLSALGEMLRADEFWSSPLTRALQTCLVGLRPALRERQRKNRGGNDTIGSALGADAMRVRALAGLRAGCGPSELAEMEAVQ